MLIDRKLMRYYSIVSGAVFTKIALMVGGFFLGRGSIIVWGHIPFS